MQFYDGSAAVAVGRAIRRSQGFAQSLSAVEPWLVGPFLVIGLMAPRLLWAGLLAAAAFWLVRWIAWGHATVRTTGDRFIGVLILMMPITLRVTLLPQTTRQQVLWLGAGIALYYVIVNWVRTAERERVVVLCLAAAGLLAALIAPVAVSWVDDIKLTFIPKAVYSGLPLLASIPVNPNVLAGVLVLGLPVPLAMLMFGWSGMQRHERFASAAAAIAMALILVLTKSRGALLAASAAALALCLLRWRRGWVFILLAALLALLVFWTIGFGQVFEKLSATGSFEGMPFRLEMWSRGVYLLRDFPLTGIGMGTFQFMAKSRYPFVLLPPYADIPHAHNIFLQVGVDLGIPGLAAWLGLLFLAAFSAWRLYVAGRRQGLGWVAGLGAGLFASQVALMIHGMVDAAVWGADSAIVVWVLWGVCAASYNLRFRPDRLAEPVPERGVVALPVLWPVEASTEDKKP